MKLPDIKKTTFTTFDKTMSITTNHQKPNRVRTLYNNTAEIQIPRGAGLSYAAASFGQDTLVKDLSSFNRILEFDPEQKTVVVESGVSLKKLLVWACSKKLFFPVMPGHPDITIGGCVGANVHGKNPLKDGSFKEHVISMELYHPKNGLKMVERDSELFDATCGGYGLTGIITKVKIQLYDLPSDKIIMKTEKTESIIHTIEIFEKNTNADVLYGWNIGSLIKNFQKGVAIVGTFANGYNDEKLLIPKETAIKNIQLPISFWNKFNSTLFFSIHRKMSLRNKEVEKDIFSSFFPLSGIAQWFHILYGKKGLREYQMLVSKKESKEFVEELIKLIEKEKPNLNIFGVKPFKGKQKLLQFCKDGISIVLNFPNSQSTNDFLPKIDELIMQYDVIPNIIKDSRLSKKVIEKCYPEYNKFKEIIEKNDPERIFRSHLSEQLGI